jgi:hypothetical protein
MDGQKSKYNKPRYKKIPDVRIKNRFNNEVFTGDIINEEDIEGTKYFIFRTTKGNVIKLSKDAHSLQKA